MRFFQLFFLVVVCQLVAHAQQNKVDSLKQILPSLNDTTKVKAFNELAYRVMFASPDEAGTYVEESMELSRKINYPKGLANAFNMRGALLDLSGEYELSVEAYLSGLEIVDKSKISSNQLRMALYNGLGLVYSRKAEYPKALDFFLKSFDLAEKAKYKFGIINVQLNIGLVYYDQKDYEKALAWFFSCRDRALEYGEEKTAAKAITNIGIVYKELHRYDEAIEYYLSGLEMKKHTNDMVSIGASFSNLADVYVAMKDYPRALAYLRKAEEAKRQADDKWGLLSVDDIRTQIFIAQGFYSKAEDLLRKNLAVAEALGGTAESTIYTRLYELYLAKKDHESALMWYVKKTEFEDSLFNEKKSAQLAALQTLFEVSKKEKEIAQLEKEKQESRFTKNILIFSIICLVATVVAVGFFIRFRIRKRQEIYDMEVKLRQNQVDHARLRELELRNEIEFKNRELTSYTMNFVQKSEMMEELKRNLQEIRSSEPLVSRKLAGTIRLIEGAYQVDREWEDFKLQFENVHSDFFTMLRQRCPDLTNGDLKLCALLKLNMNMKEAAKILGISPESVKTARYRLRKKFNLNQEDNLVDFIQNIDTVVA